MTCSFSRKRARVVEWAALEKRYTGNGIGGSNPPASAKIRNQKKQTKRGRAKGATPFRLQNPILNFGGTLWLKSEPTLMNIRTRTEPRLR